MSFHPPRSLSALSQINSVAVARCVSVSVFSSLGSAFDTQYPSCTTTTMLQHCSNTQYVVTELSSSSSRVCELNTKSVCVWLSLASSCTTCSHRWGRLFAASFDKRNSTHASACLYIMYHVTEVLSDNY